MRSLLLAVLLLQPAPFNLMVQGGDGKILKAGVFACGAEIQIEAPATISTYVTIDGKTSKVKTDLVFNQWVGDSSVELLARKTTIKMPCRDLKIHATYKSK